MNNPNKTVAKNKIVVAKSEYIKKPHRVIQIEGKLNLIQHKCWNILALNALKKGIKEGQRKYEISLTEIYKHLGYKAENDKHLKEALVAIMRIVIQGDIINKDGGLDWHAFVLLGHVYVEKGVCHYEYTTPVIDLLSNPKQYVKLLIKMQNRFSSSYSLKLYEFLKTKYIEKLGKGTTGELTVEVFRQLMGLEDGAWLEFKVLKRDLITPAIKEINEKTDLFVELELIKNRQKVVALKFQITENPNKKQNLQGLDLESLDDLDFGNEVTDTAETTAEPNNALKIKLEKLGFGENQINELLADPEPQKVLDCTDYVTFKLQQEIETNKTKNKIQSPTGYFFTIYNMYEDIDFSSLKDFRAKEDEKKNQEKDWENEQEEARRREEKQAKLSKLKQEKIAKYKLENPKEVKKICEVVLKELEKTQKFTFQQVEKEAKKKDISMVKAVETNHFTVFKVDSMIWQKIEESKP